MASYGLHLANLAEARGFDLAGSSVTKIVVAAEPLSKAKRAKLERMWGAQVFDQFGMTEGALMACEGAARTGSHLWSDLFYCEVVDEVTGELKEEGEVGALVMDASLCPDFFLSTGRAIGMLATCGSARKPGPAARVALQKSASFPRRVGNADF